MFSEDPVTGGINYGKNGLIIMPDANGLGASFSDDVLNSCENINVS